METPTDVIDVELALAQKALADAQERKARADKMALDKAAADLAAHKAAEEKRLADLRREAEEANERAKKRKQEREATERAAEAARKAEEDRLQRELSAREETLRKETERTASIKTIQEQAFAVEQEAKRVEAELLRKKNTEREAPPVNSLHDPRHPLSVIFGKSEDYQEPTQGFDSVEQAKTRSVTQDPQATWNPRKKIQRFSDSGTSSQIEKKVRKELNIAANPMRCDSLSATWEYADIMKALEIAIASAKVHPQGHDQFFAYVEGLLEGAIE